MGHARVYVVSLAESLPRRKHFAQQWAKLDLDLPARWVRAVNGRQVATPFQEEFVSVRGKNARGFAGNYESHAGLLSMSSSGMLIVFEDDAAFVSNFAERLKRFVSSVPNDWEMLHIGGDNFWDPPYAELPGVWIRARSVSRMWGYVLKESAVSKLARATAVTLDLRPIDIFYGSLAFACDARQKVNTYAPAQPLVTAVSHVSMTAEDFPMDGALLRAEQFEDEDDENILRYSSWYPSSCCNMPNLSWSKWCCTKCDLSHECPNFCRKHPKTPI